MADSPTDIGSRLRQAREERGLTLHDIANATKISMVVLRAIEADDFSRLPGGLFARSYVRAFAAQVGLNPDDIASEYRERVEPQLPDATLASGVHPPDHRMETLGRVATVVVGIGALVVMLQFSKSGQAPREIPPWEPTRTAQIGLEAESPEPNEPRAADLVAMASTSASVPLRLEMRFARPCWVSATADGDVVIYRLMQPGEQAVVEAQDAIALRIGDAAAVIYTINGAPGRPLGRAGQVVTLDITGDNYEHLLDELARSRFWASSNL